MSGRSVAERVINLIDRVNSCVGHVVMWLALSMAIVQFAIVIMRYVFAIGFISLQESVWYMHGLLFMLGAGFTLMCDEHVRVDVFYRAMSPRRKALVDCLGSLFLLVPLCVVTLWFSGSYVVNSWRVLERSTENSGLPFIYLLKTSIWVFSILLFWQGIALAMRAWLAFYNVSPSYSARSENINAES